MKEYKFGINVFVIVFVIVFLSIVVFLLSQNYIHDGFHRNSLIDLTMLLWVISFSCLIIYFTIALFYRILNINQKIIVYADHILAPRSMPCFAKPNIIRIDEISECTFVINKINFITKSELYIKTKNKTYFYNESYLARNVAKELAEDINKIISEREK